MTRAGDGFEDPVTLFGLAQEPARSARIAA